MSNLTSWIRSEIGPKDIERELKRVPYLITKVAIPHNTFDVKIDVAALSSVSAQSKSHGVGSTLWDAIGIIGSL